MTTPPLPQPIPPAFDGLTLHLGSVHGSRSFYLTHEGWLTGVVKRIRWTEGVNVATCRAAVPPEQRCTSAPGASPCKCGFYAYFSGSLDYATVSNISGVVEGFGRAVIGQRGFRVEKARIRALYLPRTWLPRVPVPTSDPTVLKAWAVTSNPVRSADLQSMLRDHYPTTPFYDDLAAMLRDFPTDRPSEGR